MSNHTLVPMEYTLTPWGLVAKPYGLDIVDSSGETICTVEPTPSGDVPDYVALLLAAPDCYEACKSSGDSVGWENGPDMLDGVADEMGKYGYRGTAECLRRKAAAERTAIAKAKGGL